MNAIEAKILPPVLPSWILPRPRLLARILAPHVGLALLQAPAGYGKSVLAAQVAQASRLALAWLYLDRADADPRRLCGHLAASLATAHSALAGTELAAEIEAPEFQPGRWIEDLLLFLERSLRGDCMLVLDNLEAAVVDSGASGLLERLVSYRPRRLKIVLTSRVRPPFGLARRSASGEAVVLTAEHLAFSLAEFEEAFRLRGTGRAAIPLQEWWSRTGGWPVALGLHAMGPSGRMTEADPQPGYIREEVLGNLPPECVGFLRRTCLLDTLSPEFARAMGDEEEFSARVQQLTSLGVPHMNLPDGTVRVHPWIREILVGCLRSDGGPETEQVAGRTSNLFIGQGRYDLAAQSWFDLGLVERGLGLLVRDMTQILARNLIGRVEAWIERLPSRWRSHPLYAVCLTSSLVSSGRMHKLAEYVAELRPHWSQLEESEHFRLLWKNMVLSREVSASGPSYEEIARQWDRYCASGHQTTTGVEMALGATALFDLRLDDAERHFLAAHELAPDNPRKQRDARSALGVTLVERGRPGQALVRFEEVLAESTRENSGEQVAFALLGIASAYRDQGRFHDALQAAERSVAAARETGMAIHHVTPHVHYLRGESLWNLGRPREAVVELEAAWTGFLDSSRYNGLSCGATLDHYQTVLGNPSQRVKDSDFAHAPVCEARVRFLIRKSRWQALQGDTRGACESARMAREVAGPMPQMQATAWFGEGWARFQAGDLDPAREGLLRGHETLEELGWKNFPMADPILIGWVVTQSIASGRFVERALSLAGGERVLDLHDAFERALTSRTTSRDQAEALAACAARLRVRGLERILARMPGVPKPVRDDYARASAEAPLPPLRVTMMGEFRCEALGRVARFQRRASRRALQHLLLEHPRPVHEEKLAEAMWPETDPSLGKPRLQTAINELRRALDPHIRPRGAAYVTYREEHYRIELPPGSTVDYHELQARLKELLRGDSDPESPKDRSRLLATVLNAYTGELLEDDPYSEEAAEPRERLRAQVLEVTMRILRPLVPEGREEVLPLLERALQIDPLWAEGVMLRIEALHRMGRPVAAVRAYSEYEARLLTDLGARPDREMQDLIQRVTASP